MYVAPSFTYNWLNVLDLGHSAEVDYINQIGGYRGGLMACPSTLTQIKKNKRRKKEYRDKRVLLEFDIYTRFF